MNATMRMIAAINDTVVTNHAKRAWNKYVKAMEIKQETMVFENAMKALTTMSDECFDMLSSLAKDEDSTISQHGNEDFSDLLNVWWYYQSRGINTSTYDYIPSKDEVEMYIEQPCHPKAHSARNTRRAHNIRDTRKHGLPKYFSKYYCGRNDYWNEKRNYKHRNWMDIELMSI